MKTSRRDALAHGGKVIAAAAVLSTLPSIAHAKEDAELFALREKWSRLLREFGAAEARSSEAGFAVRDRFPELKGDALAEAMKQAGVPALRKKERDAYDSWSDVERRIFAYRANTPQGMILKLTIDWTDRMRRDWPAKGLAADVQFLDEGTASVLLDLERLADQRRAI